MNRTLPTRLMSTDRAAAVDAGRRRAHDIVTAAFPPRPEDPDGTLALSAVEVATNQVLHTELRHLDAGHVNRQWWLEGLVLGYCAAATEALEASTMWLDLSPTQHLDEMEATILPQLDPDQADASRVVFALCRALLDDDDIALVWALENTWRPTTDLSTPTMLHRVRAVVSAALMTSCAAWRVLLLAADTRD